MFNFPQTKAESYLHNFCVEIDNRRVGSVGNRAAVDFFADTVASFGFETETPWFECMDWVGEGAVLSVEDHSFAVFPSPYSLGCKVTAPLVVVDSIEALEAADITDKVLLLHGAIASEQLMPKNFPFYNPDHHRRIIQLLEIGKPAAVVAATSQDVTMVGGQYPFPLIEDGDFDIPSVYMTEAEGARLAAFAGKKVFLQSDARRITAEACNVIARKGTNEQQRLVVMAHIDAKLGTPGATDNAGGVSVLLLLAELLADYQGELTIELVAINGEDYFSNPGEQQYLALNAGKFNEIVLGINIDGVGYHRGRVAYSLYDCPAETAGIINDVLSRYEVLTPGEAWYQGDHGLFLINEVPALAFTSEYAAELMQTITHTPKDDLEIVKPSQLVKLAVALCELIFRLEQQTALKMEVVSC